MNNWKETTLGELSLKITKGTTPTTEGGGFTAHGINFIKAESISDDGRFIESKFSYIDRETNEKLKRSIIEENDILFSIAGVIGRVALVDKSVLPANTNQALAIVRLDKNKIIPKFAYYYLNNKQQIKYANSLVAQSVQANINLAQLGGMPINLPSLDGQKEIAAVLGSLDDKIELLRAQNETLEKIAQTIFKEWFVNFTINGEKLKLENGIPEGWRVGKLGDFFPVLTGKRNANHAKEKGQYPFFTCSQGSFLCGEYSFDGSAILLAGNGDFNLKWYEGKFDAYQRTYVLMPHKKELLGFLFFLMKYYLDDIAVGQRGSVIKFLTKGMIEDFRIYIPKDEKTLDDMAKPFYEILRKIDFNNSQIQTLSRLRDTLLPKLMSGEMVIENI